MAERIPIFLNLHRAPNLRSRRWSIRNCNLLYPKNSFLLTPKPPRPLTKIRDCLLHISRRQIRKQLVEEYPLRVRTLPQEEVARPLLAGSPEDQIDIRKCGRVEQRTEGLLGDGRGIGEFLHRAEECGWAAVVDGEVEGELRLIFGFLFHFLDQRGERCGNPIEAARVDEA